MERYIDADKLVEMYERSVNEDWNKRTSPSSWAGAYECVIADIDDQPTADVVPRAEVEQIFAEIGRIVYFRDFVTGGMLFELAELKKKYIGDKQRKEDEKNG